MDFRSEKNSLQDAEIFNLFFSKPENESGPTGASGSSDDTGILMPPPPPPSAIPAYLTQGLANFTFISPSKEGEVPMEFSPGAKKDISSGAKIEFSPGAKTQISPEDERDFGSGSKRSIKSPECKAMLDAIEVKETSNEGNEEGDFLKRQQKPNLRRCRSLEMRKRLFDMSNTPPTTFKPVFKRQANDDHNEQTYTKIAKRPKDLQLSSIRERCNASTERLCGSSNAQQTLASEPVKDSDDHERIKVAVDALQSPEMIGDCSREHSLDVINGKHSDLKNIGHETMAHILTHGARGRFDKMTIIDCRYPYEYNGGHIMNAVNFYTEGQIDKFLQKELLEVTGKSPPPSHILIFHCEFSSQRGPGLLRYLRKKDRLMNVHQYPQLTFPEIYVLHLGYKEFFNNHPHLCVPSAYIPMADESYIEDLKHFRAKAKSWAAGERTRSSKR